MILYAVSGGRNTGARWNGHTAPKPLVAASITSVPIIFVALLINSVIVEEFAEGVSFGRCLPTQ